jgi:spore maturation protein SpmA
VLNYIWLALVLLAVAIGGWNNRWKEVTDGAFDGAKTVVSPLQFARCNDVTVLTI